MNIVLSKGEKCHCDYTREYNVNSYENLKKLTSVKSIINVKIKKSGLIEKAVVDIKNITIISDSFKFKYFEVLFIINIKCPLRSVINIDGVYYCEDCLEYNGFDYEILKNSLIDKTYGMTVSKKIHYILIDSKKEMTSREIFTKGLPWDLKGETPFKTVSTKCIYLKNNGIIKKIGNKYSVYFS